MAQGGAAGVVTQAFSSVGSSSSSSGPTAPEKTRLPARSMLPGTERMRETAGPSPENEAPMARTRVRHVCSCNNQRQTGPAHYLCANVQPHRHGPEDQAAQTVADE